MSIRQDDYGTKFEVTINDENGVVDVSGATTKNIIFEKPSGTKITQAASFTNSGTDGKIEYTTVSGDLNEAGTWKIQAQIATVDGDWKSNISAFPVEPNL